MVPDGFLHPRHPPREVSGRAQKGKLRLGEQRGTPKGAEPDASWQESLHPQGAGIPSLGDVRGVRKRGCEEGDVRVKDTRR